MSITLNVQTTMLHTGLLAASGAIRHGFFTRAGGVSGGLYASLNAGVGSHEYRDSKALHLAIGKLPKRQRTALELLKLHEMSLKQASAASGMSIDALKVSAHRAIKALRASFNA